MSVRNTLRITQTAATVASLMGFSMGPDADIPNALVLDAARFRVGREPFQRALLYNPDAIALWLYQKYPQLFAPVIRNTTVTLPVYSVMPSVTPVCFASMYTGLNPAGHGIQSYVKPVLRVQTLFDAAIAAGHQPVIISTEGDSISRIFLEREMDYILCKTPEECNANALAVIRDNCHDIVVVYNGNYDAQMHRWGPESEEALAQLSHNTAAFETLCGAAQAAWSGMPWFAGFLPDHGCHEIDGNLGSHGLDMPEDMNIVHFYRFSGK